MTEAEAMRRALDLAWRGWGRVHPNPMVGAVLLRDGTVVGEGWHAEFGGPHAERVALDAAGAAARGATLVLTLEPCAHQGKQPPCAPLVADAGVRRVVLALRDPDRTAAGGAEVLRARGVDVAELPGFAAEVAAQNAAFVHRSAAPGRPWVALKLATSLDGRIADGEGRSRWISGPEAREWAHWLRAGFDAIAVGAETARRDDPALTVRGGVTPRREPLRVVFIRETALPDDLRLLQEGPGRPAVVVRVGGARGQGGGVPELSAPDLAGALRALHTLGVESLLVEGGGRLAGALLAEGLVDRLYWVQAPLWLGDGVPAVAGLPAVSLGTAARWRVSERRPLGEDTLLVADRTCSPAS
jgi:diaminohydroxyphosphoribosylaminopyrimidine deaminase/5-amino-6-(5-phosphoribosylamino)uracil reductase